MKDDPIRICQCAECYCAFPLSLNYNPQFCPRCLMDDHMSTDYALPIYVLEKTYMRRLEEPNDAKA